MMHNHGTAGGTTTVGSTLLGRGPQPGWMTLDDARERAFTGEIVFEVEPEVRAYLDNGTVYYAERSTDVSLAQRLLATGLVDPEQLERGTVRVGEVEHLGRLFDREATVDRDAVLVATELDTAMLIATIANETICTVRSTAYRHHASGVHRWFATPVDGLVDRRFGGMSLLDSCVVDDVAGLPSVTEHSVVDELYIEWDEPIIGGATIDADETFVEEFDDSLLQAMLDESVMQYDVIEFDEVAEIDRVAEMSTVEIEYLEIEEMDLPSFDESAFEFTEIADGIDAPEHDDLNGEVVGIVVDSDEFIVMWPSVDDVTATPELEAVETDHADVVDVVEEPQSADDLSMTPIETWDEEVVADVPSEVAAAVKRALAALERITQEHPIVAPILQPSEFDDVHAPVVPAPVVAGFAGFAPPTLDMSAEAIYARATTQLEADTSAQPVSFDQSPVIDGSVDELAHVSDGAAVVDDETSPRPGDDSNERSSALRRLIGSLRRKDR
jgi:hypothetical protein